VSKYCDETETKPKPKTVFLRPDSLLRLWRYINHLLTYLLT